MNKKRRKVKRKLNNNGSSIVFVIVVMALMGVLVTTICYMCVANFYMKANDRQSKNNFYSAETVLEEIKAGIQAEASAAVDTAYMDVIQSYEKYSGDSSARTDAFKSRYVKSIRNSYQSGNDQHYNLDKLKSYVKSVSVVNEAAGESFNGFVGAEITIDGGVDKNEMVAYNSAVVLRNIKVRYRDVKGYVSIIKTDLRVEIPNVSFESNFEIPEIISYSLIAANRLTIHNNYKSTISGSVYGGRLGIEAKGNSVMYFKEAPAVITSNLVKVSDGASITMDDKTTLWAGGTLLAGGQADSRPSTLNLLGSAYVQDDTTLQGTSNTLNVKGKYLGFGDSKTGAENSSAILINGTKSKVDISSMDRLFLPGNAYIGVNKERDVTDASVALGESLTAKSSQIAYMVPPECIGYVDGECVLGTNPVLYSKWQSAYNNVPSSNKMEVDYTKMSKSGIDYATKYHAGFQTKYVTIPNGTSAGDTLIYYYVSFTGSDGTALQDKAAEFFKDYFSENEENIRKYLDIYVDDLNIENIERLNIAGNMLHKVEQTDEDGNVIIKDGEVQYKYELINETKTADETAGAVYATEVSTYKNVFKGLTTKLVKQGTDITDTSTEYKNVFETQVDGSGDVLLDSNGDVVYMNPRGIFDNLINPTVFQAIVNSPEASVNGYAHEVWFKNDTEGVKAVVKDGDYTVGNDTPLTTSLIIASGDVHIEKAFKGTIVSGGTITIEFDAHGDGSDIDINHDRDMVRHVLNIANDFTDATNPSGAKLSYAPKDLFNASVGITTNKDAGTSTGDIVIEDLVSYENWTKE